MKLTFSPIGIIHSPFTQANETPIQPLFSPAVGKVELFTRFSPGLVDLDGFSHIFLLYAFHCSHGYELMVQPYLDDSPHGLFSTRHPRRPNPIGLSVVRLLEIHENFLDIEGVDVLDGTPLLDIKPYIPEFDTRQDASQGWHQTRSRERKG